MTGPIRVALVARAGSVNVQRWCEALVGAGAVVEILSFESWETDVAPVHRLWGRRFPGRLGYVVAGPQVWRWCRRHRPDVLIGYFVTGYGTTAALARWRPVIQVAAGSDVLGPQPGRLKRLMRRRNLAHADLVLVMAAHMEEAVVRAGARPETVLALPHGIALDEFRPVDAPRPPGSVISTRSLEPYYRHDVVLEAVRSCPAVTLTVAGTGSAAEDLKRFVDRLHVGDRVRFVGEVSNRDLPQMLAAHAVFVSASPTDGVSASLLEAMAAGLVPVVVDNPANRTWVSSGENGLLFAAGSASDLATQLQRAVSDDELRMRAVLANPQVVARQGDARRNAERFVDAVKPMLTDRR